MMSKNILHPDRTQMDI